MKWSDFVYLVVGIIIPTYQMLDWIFKNFGKSIKRRIIRSAIDAAVYHHYKMQKMRQGHAAKFPADCNDGDCATIKR